MPGFWRTRHKSGVKPAAMAAPRTKSWGPTETPPEVTTTSEPAAAEAIAATVASSQSPTRTRETTSPPEATTTAASIGPLESRICPACRETEPVSSAPVMTRATRGRA